MVLGYSIPENHTPKFDTMKNITEAPKAEAIRLGMRILFSENMPKHTTQTLKSGEVRPKEKTQRQLRQEYAQSVFGLTVFVAACSFNLNACIRECVISGYTRRRDRAGELTDDYIYSVRIPRSSLQNGTVSDPEQFITSCESRLIVTPTYVFKSIIPF
jgi:hypothetical protein